MTTKSKKPLTLDQLADIYDANHSGRKARTLPIDTIIDWAIAHKNCVNYNKVKDEFYVL